MISPSVEQGILFDDVSRPTKKYVINDDLLKDVLKNKNMPFAVVVGDQPVYTLIVEIKNENPEKFDKVIPFLGPFAEYQMMFSLKNIFYNLLLLFFEPSYSRAHNMFN